MSFESHRAPLEAVDLKKTPARRVFKRNLGQANHFLITILVGLDAVSAGGVQLSPTFSTSWNPKDPSASAARSRGFAQRAALSLLIDSLDGFVAAAVRPPRTIQDPEAADALVAASDSTDRLETFARLCGIHGGVEWALVNVARVWRHRLTHSNSRARVTQPVEDVLLAASSGVQKDYQGLDPKLLISHCYAGEPPHFKETTALIRGAHRFVQRSDRFVLSRIDVMAFCSDALDAWILNAPTNQAKRAVNLFGKDQERRRRAVVNVLGTYGVTVPPFDRMDPSDRDAIVQLASQRPADVKMRLRLP